MPEKEFENKNSKPVSRIIPISTPIPAIEQLQTMRTDELVKLFLSPEMSKPVNAAIRQQIITFLQKREGNAFVQRLLGKPAPGKSP